MAFADKLKISCTPESKRIHKEYAERFEQLSGFEYPPKNSASWAVILVRAGFSEKRIEQFLTGIGAEGFDVGELPAAYTSASSDDWPIFSARLLEGLARWRREESGRATATDSVADKVRKIPRDELTRRSIEYVNRHRRKASRGEVERMDLQDLIAEFAGIHGEKEVKRILRALRPDRHGCHLVADK